MTATARVLARIRAGGHVVHTQNRTEWVTASAGWWCWRRVGGALVGYWHATEYGAAVRMLRALRSEGRCE